MAENSNSLTEKSQSPSLPRTAWKSELTFFKAILKAKQALDKREKAVLNK